jgi:hypothetical protein
MGYGVRDLKGLGSLDPFWIIVHWVVVKRGHGVLPKNLLVNRSGKRGELLPDLHGCKSQFRHGYDLQFSRKFMCLV